MSHDRKDIIPEPALTPAADLLAAGRALARDWQVGPSAFLDHVGHPSEAAYKRAGMADGRIMQHAQLGFREPAKSRRAYGEIYEACRKQGVVVDRYGLCLDWSMGYPRDRRKGQQRGTGMILDRPEDFVTLTASAPVAPHFGDFVLGFPAAVENTQAALAAGSTAIGNLGQFFTFRLPGWDDEVALTEATVTALALIAAQDVEVLVHSNLDDGFAALFTDLACCLGAVLIERYIVEELIGAPVSHCYGHHFSDPLTRLAFQRALAEANPTPGTIIYGNTVSYRRTPPGNFASLGAYLLADIVGQRTMPSGHAINPVPVTENERIPDIDEIVDAQLFAARLADHAVDYVSLIDMTEVDRTAQEILAGGRVFKERVLAGLGEAGFDVADPMELLLALRRLSAKRLEELFGPGAEDAARPHGRRPMVAATTMVELEAAAADYLQSVSAAAKDRLAGAGLTAVVATTDVHEHGKLLLEQVLSGLAIGLIDGGVSTDPDDLARLAAQSGADVVAVSTYNGVALSFFAALKDEMAALGLETPVMIGGRLNQVPDGSNSSLPVDVADELAKAGAIICRRVEDAFPVLEALARDKGQD